MARVGFLSLVVAVVVLAGGGLAWGSTQAEMQAAASQGKAVFLVVTQPNTRGTDRAIQIANQARAMAPNTQVVVLDRSAAENQELVQRYRVLGAPVPLVLVVAPNGVVAGGALLRDATPQVLVRLIPTPRKAEMLLHLTQKTPVFVVISRKTMVEQKSAIFEACTEAMRRLQPKAATVVVDMDDKTEKAWLQELKISPKEEAPVTIVFNAKGQKTQVFRGPVTAEQLVDAVNKKVECCPGGSC